MTNPTSHEQLKHIHHDADHNHDQGDQVMTDSMAGHDQHHENHDELRNAEWEKQSAAYDRLSELFQNSTTVALSQEQDVDSDLRAAFEEAMNLDINEIVVECIDDGMPRIWSSTDATKGVLQIGIGGAGVLLKDELDQFVDYLVSISAEGQSIRVQAHGGCGAAKIANDGHGTPAEVNTIAGNFGQTLAETLTERKKQIDPNAAAINYSFVAEGEMTRPPEIHTAMGAVIDTTANYNQTTSTDPSTLTALLPKMFNIAGYYGLPDHVAANVKIAQGIAFGDHGFKGKFTPEKPFILMVVVDRKNGNSVKSADELLPALNNFANSIGVSEELALDDGSYYERKGCVVVRVLDVTKPDEME